MVGKVFGTVGWPPATLYKLFPISTRNTLPKLEWPPKARIYCHYPCAWWPPDYHIPKSADKLVMPGSDHPVAESGTSHAYLEIMSDSDPMRYNL